jgi:hypothetical protein
MIRDAVISKIVKQNPDLCDWPFWKAYIVLNPTTTAQYQHYLTVAYRFGMLYDFRDLRFFQGDGTELDYWIESQTNGSSASVWVKPERASQTRIYCFYGNPEAVSRSSGAKTFDFFEGFYSGTLNAAKWTVNSGQSYSISNNIITVTGAGDAADNITSIPTFGLGYGFRSYSAWSNAGGSSIFGFADLSNYAADFFNSNGYSAYAKNGASDHASGTNPAYGETYYTYAVNRISSSSLKIYRDSTLLLDANAAAIPQGALPVVMRQYTNGDTQKHNYILIRKLVATEPTVQVLSYGNRNPEYR